MFKLRCDLYFQILVYSYLHELSLYSAFVSCVETLPFESYLFKLPYLDLSLNVTVYTYCLSYLLYKLFRRGRFKNNSATVVRVSY